MKLSKILRVRYILTTLLFVTILILILNPNYLYDNGEYFRTEYTEIRRASSYKFLPENPYWDIVLLWESIGKIEFEYMNLDTNKIKQSEILNYSTNSEIDKYSFFLYYDKEDKIVYTILTNDGNNYKLFELNQQGKHTFRTKSYNIYKHDTYESLKTLGSIIINSIKFYPYKIVNKPGIDFEVEPFKDGVRLVFPTDMLTSLTGYTYRDEIETDETHIKIAEVLSEKLGKKFKALDIYKIRTYFIQKNYYIKKIFSKPDYKQRGFLPATILGKIDVNNDKKKDFLILIHGHRFLNDRLLCIDAQNEEIIYEKEFAPSLHDYEIVDIDNDGFEEILLSFYSPCYEFPFNWHDNKTPGTNYKARFYILDNKFNIRKINNNIAIESEPGFYHYRFLYLKETNKILLGLRSNFNNSDKKLLLYDIKNDKIDTLDVMYQNLYGIKKEKNSIVFWNFVKNKLAKITLDNNFQIKDSINVLVDKKFGAIKQTKIKINNHDYTILDPLTIIDDKLNIMYRPEQKILKGTIAWKGNDCYFIELKNDRKFFSKLHFERNKTINPYLIIILLIEVLLIITYLLIFQIIKIPLNTGTSSYFVLYTFFGKFYYWQLHGRLKTIYKLPKNVSLSKDIPEKIFHDIAEQILVVIEKSYLFFKYKVYEIKQHDESEIIQRISHDLKNQVLMMKLLTDQYADQFPLQNKGYIEQVSSSLKAISSAANTLSNFSHIDKLYLEEVEFNSFIKQLLMNYLNHNLFENINYEPYSEEIKINLDENLFRIAFDNLIKNALDEIKQEDTIKVIIEKKSNKINLRISNSYHDDDRVSTEFSKVGFSTKIEGSGIGLPISKVIIERHDGDLICFIKDKMFIVKISLPEK